MTQLTLQQALQMAGPHHQAGQLPQAEQLYRQILAEQPKHAGALHLLGVIAYQVGRHEIAMDLIGQAIALQPSYPEALNNLGLALRDRGQLDEAIAAHRRAIAIKPDFSEAHSNLGVALNEKGHLDKAIAAYRQAIVLKPDFPEAHINLGNALRDKGNLDEAIASYHRALVLKPNSPDAHGNLGLALRDQGHHDDAIVAFRQAITLKPNYLEAHVNLGNALRDKGQLDESIAAYRQAIALKPNSPDAHGNLGLALRGKGHHDDAIVAFRQAIALRPEFPEAHSNLGNVLKDKGQLDEAIVFYRQAIALKPKYPEAHSNLGVALRDKGRHDDAIIAFRQAIAFKPNYPEAHSNLVYSLHFHPGHDAQAIAEEHQHWNRRHAEPLQRFILPHANDRSPDRRLRIGYVSPDFRAHLQSCFTVPLLENHDHAVNEIYCYSSVARPDAVTQRLQAHADVWRHLRGESNETLARIIRQDHIDILVDLTLHMAENRLLLVARKPAPVQVSWLAYPASSGLSTIDYRLSDPFLDPPGMDESTQPERTLRLPDSFWCYDPLDGRDIPVNALPALANGYVTFGCLNNFCKVNDAVLARWAQVLRQVEDCRLTLLAQQGDHRRRTLDFLKGEGIQPACVEFVPFQPRQEYLKLYHRIDLCLDTFPYNGHTTSLDSFWMGVPVVTLVGRTAVARAGWSQLSNLGLPDLAGRTPEEFVRTAVELARDLPRLQDLRSNLRRRMEQSPLMDAPRFARSIETAYRRMLRQWCATPG
jgi:protein O-GlcNAc transferase